MPQVHRSKRQQQAQVIRIARKLHRIAGVFLFVFFFLMGITGGVLGWKKHTGGVILPKTATGSSQELAAWLPLDSLERVAQYNLRQNSPIRNPTVSRIDIRPDKGVAKFLFEEGNWEVQLDGATAAVLSIGQRHADFIENLHDGSVIDPLLGNKGIFKLVYTTLMSLALVVFTITGFWLWYGPKQMRKKK